MALTKPNKALWFDINEYAKITSYKTEETWIDNDWKYYTVNVEVKYYTDNTKQYEIRDWKINHYSLQWLRQNELTLEWIYIKLNWITEFEWYTEI